MWTMTNNSMNKAIFAAAVLIGALGCQDYPEVAGRGPTTPATQGTVGEPVHSIKVYVAPRENPDAKQLVEVRPAASLVDRALLPIEDGQLTEQNGSPPLPAGEL